MPAPTERDWLQQGPEGQLGIDVFREKNELVIRAFVAGVKPEDVDISLHGDLLTIRAHRKHERDVGEEDWFYRECYWGAFSRSIVLPYDVAAEETKATVKNGLLEIRIPLRDKPRKVSVSIMEE